MSFTFLLTVTMAAMLMALLYVILKYFQLFQVNNIQGLTFNYITASVFSFSNNLRNNLNSLIEPPDFIVYAFGIGILFIAVFYIATLTAQYSGITITSIAGKMSMIIPVGGGIIFFQEVFNISRATGIVTALAAVVLSSYKPLSGDGQLPGSKKLTWILPMLLFIGSGLVDFSIKLSEHYFITEENKSLFISLLFGSAAIAGTGITIYNSIQNKIRIEVRSITGGVILGIANFYSLEFLIRALSFPGIDSALVFCIANVLVVLISVLTALLLFHEKISKINFAGIFLSILSILILTS